MLTFEFNGGAPGFGITHGCVLYLHDYDRSSEVMVCFDLPDLQGETFAVFFFFSHDSDMCAIAIPSIRASYRVGSDDCDGVASALRESGLDEGFAQGVAALLNVVVRVRAVGIHPCNEPRDYAHFDGHLHDADQAVAALRQEMREWMD